MHKGEPESRDWKDSFCFGMVLTIGFFVSAMVINSIWRVFT